MKTWDLLRHLARDSNLPWCVIGDINNVVSQDDKHGGAPYPRWLIEGFNEALVDTGLYDMNLVGHQYTWERGRGTSEWTEVRFDRALTTSSWLDLFPLAKLYNLEGSTSDHSPLILVPQQKSQSFVRHRFRFENAWLTEPMCEQLTRDAWESSEGCTIQLKVKKCGEQLLEWGKELTGNSGIRIKKCKEAMKKLRNKRDMQSQLNYNTVKKELTLILNQREIFWRQRSKQLWLHSGDQNSRYFHAAASTRRRNNQIHRLQDEYGHWVDWDTGLTDLMSNYCTALFTSTSSNYNDVTQWIPTTIFATQNEELLLPISDEEVKNAVFQMHPDKSPGPDGMTPGFYQKHWKIVGPDVIAMVRDFFVTGSIPTGLNETNVVLIPKKKCPTKMTKLRPISLCNVLVKIITKVMVNRMKAVLESVVSDNQSAFISGRLISDNVMISYEVMHYLKRKRRGKDGFMALKLDMSKAFDRIEWKYLEAVLLKMGFHDRWVYLILQCVSTVSYQIVHYNKEIGPILPSRGLRQGDPLSLFLSIICAEGISAPLKHYETQKWIHGIEVCRKAPSITHMLFADDSYLYCQASEEEVLRLRELLRTFELASGQKVNLQKSSVFFSSNVVHSNRDHLCHLLQMQEATSNTTYLGLPNMMGRSKSATLGFLKDKF